MPNETGLWVVLVDEHRFEASRRVPCRMTGGLGGFRRSLAAPVQLQAAWDGRMNVGLYDAPVGGIELEFKTLNQDGFDMEKDDILHLS